MGMHRREGAREGGMQGCKERERGGEEREGWSDPTIIYIYNGAS